MIPRTDLEIHLGIDSRKVISTEFVLYTVLFVSIFDFILGDWGWFRSQQKRIAVVHQRELLKDFSSKIRSILPSEIMVFIIVVQNVIQLKRYEFIVTVASTGPLIPDLIVQSGRDKTRHSEKSLQCLESRQVPTIGSLPFLKFNKSIQCFIPSYISVEHYKTFCCHHECRIYCS